MKPSSDTTRTGHRAHRATERPSAHQAAPATAPSPDAPARDERVTSPYRGLVIYLLLGIYMGIVFTKGEVISWFRIQEMFRFQSFHMYGIIGSAVAVAALSVWLIRRYKVRTLAGEPIEIAPKKLGRLNTRYWLGGIIFGLGWALTGACPGPIFALIGAGVEVMLVTLLSALAGTWAYAALRPYLPHY